MTDIKQSQIHWLLGCIVILALGLRLPLLSSSFWLDEAAQALESARPLSQQLEIVPDFQPPLIHLLTHVALYVSPAEWWLRAIVALIPGLVTIVVVYKLGALLVKPSVGLLAALLLATSSFHIFYSQELRPYSLPAMFAVLSWWSLLEAKRPQGVSGKKWWLLYGVWTVLGLYSSFLYPFLMLGQLVWTTVYQRKVLRPTLITMFIAGLAFVPWLPTLRLQLEAGGIVRQNLPGWSEVVSVPQLKSLPLVAGKFIYGVLDLNASWFYIVTGLLLTISLVVVGYRWWITTQTKPGARRSMGLLAIWLVVPLITAWIISFWIPVVQPKRVLYLLPAAYLAVSAIVVQAKAVRFSYLPIAILLAINVFSVAAYYSNPVYQRENWRELHHEIVSSYPADRSLAVFIFPEPFAPWRWYDDGEYPTLSTGTLHIEQVVDLQETLEPVTDYQYLLVFDYLRDLTDPDDRILQEIEAFGFRPVELIDYPNIGYVRVYARPEAVMSLRVTEE